MQQRPGAVFCAAITLIVAFVAWAALWRENLSGVMTAASNWSAANIGWAYLAVTSGCIVLLLYLGISRFGRIPPARRGR